MSDDLARMDATAQAELVESGDATPVELLEAALERAAQVNPEINAIIHDLADEAREQAAADVPDGPFKGVPFLLKDLGAAYAGQPLHMGMRLLKEADFRAPVDTFLADRFRAAGLITFGKTNTPELGILPTSEPEAYGPSKNPWDTTRTPGGSSGGSAAAVAAGIVPMAHANDGGGSIRIPAACCGLFGLKPQRGRISLMPYREHWYGLSANGCLSRRVADTALWLDVTAGRIEGDADTPPPVESFAAAAMTPPGKLRIAATTKSPRGPLPPKLDDRVVTAFEATKEVLRGLGHEVVDRAPDWGGVGNDFVPRYLRGIAQDVDEVEHPERLEPRTRGFGKLGHRIPERVLQKSLRRQGEHAARINAIFDEFDVVLTPTTGEPAVEIGRWAGMGALRTLLGMARTYPYTPVWNHTGQPAASIPAPVPAGSLPVGMTVVAPPDREDLLLSLSAQVEAETAWPERIPEIAA